MLFLTLSRYYLKAAWYFKERKLACSLYKGHVKSSMKNFRVKYGKKNCASKQCPLSSIFTLYPCDGHGILSNIFPTVRISFLFFFFFFFFFFEKLYQSTATLLNRFDDFYDFEIVTPVSICSHVRMKRAKFRFS